jgi:hypothetical protein
VYPPATARVHVEDADHAVFGGAAADEIEDAHG